MALYVQAEPFKREEEAMAGVQRYKNASTAKGSKNKMQERYPSMRKDKWNGHHNVTSVETKCQNSPPSR